MVEENWEVRNMAAFSAGLFVGATLVTVVLGAHFVKLTGELREQIAKLQTDLRHK